MTVTNVFPLVVSISAVLVVVADLGTDADRRAAAAARHRAWWIRLTRLSVAQVIARAAAGLCGVRGIRHGAGRLVRREILGVAALAVGFIPLGAFLIGAQPGQTTSHGLTYFAGPIVLGACLAVCLAMIALVRIARTRSLAAQLAWTVALVAATAALWGAETHLGLWLVWREKSTPTAYGSEWFYAEVYMDYVRDVDGLVIALATVLAVAMPATIYLARAAGGVACMFLRPALAPAATRLFDHFARARRGFYALAAVLLTTLVVG